MKKETKEKLDYFVEKYNNSTFIEPDPIGLVHRFSDQKDIEIFGLIIATLSWGNRKSIIKSGENLLKIMDNEPFKFVLNFNENELNLLNDFKHRTFNVFDLQFFILRLQKIYKRFSSLEELFAPDFKKNKNSLEAIVNFRKEFLGEHHEIRTKKHVANPIKGSAAKRINMFLRWMVRNDNNGVDFGLWKSIPTSYLSIPLDVHTGNVARKLGLLSRKQNDAKALIELDKKLRELDPIDPVKYDYALFGLGAFEGF